MEDTDDPFEELAASACNLLADNVGVRYSGVVAMETESLKTGSSEFLRLPEELRHHVVSAIVSTIGSAAFDEDAARSSQLIEVAVDQELGGRAASLFFPETETVVFLLPMSDQPVDVTRFRRAAVSALPIIYRIDDLREERARLVQKHGLLSYVEELAKVGGWEHSLATGRLLWSNELYAIHGLEPGDELTLDRVLQLYPSPGREKLSIEFERAAAEGGSFDMTAPIRTPAGERRIVRTVARSGTGRAGRMLYGITQDVTAQLSAERRLWWAANHDPVTSLPNRLLFEDRLSVAVQRARRDKRTFALVLIEISDFARLTDRAGYTVPDSHMMEVAGRLGTVTRASDTIARVSLNEFALLLYDINDNESLKAPMSRLKGQIEEMQSLDKGDGILMSAGVAFYPSHATGAEELMRAGEMALAQAKRKLSNPIVVFDRQIADDVAKRRETILGRARESLAKREFVPYYQPQIDIETNEVVGVEALVRWQTPDMLLDAKDFTYALDDHEIGSRVGRAVLDAVITDIAKLRQITDRPFRVSINASRTEVLRNDFLDTFLERTRNGNLKPNDFIIEITEDVIIGVDDQALHDKISFLVSSGVEFSLDDFGTGYASLIHITSFPVKEIKIDKQFIFGIETDRRKRAIVKGIIQIARSMGLHVIAEGVETTEQQEVLRDIGCRYAQGYLYSFPVPFSQFADMLERP
ncbi:putative bifunctional diguanylate cyclase/phosphodiesterase [Acuticoccus mangrovi]|uniref:GGDEF domain-containing protein n=1 Tax=Acuticoccus mangrovi TaxID=2796142 RepID=A0A934IJM7_9HYPH|nr:bifunctional diguanylate cyclase/phosphodiesterase [Acuticoccus mangrovi]MBJ3777708.1 GGDEF domain-containing protein [Acuticoccus mangrovi]